MIFDIDSHFEPGEDWLDPYPELSSRLPTLNPAITAIDGIAGNLLRDVPEADQPTVEELTPPGLLTLFAQEKEGEAERRAEFEGHNQFEVANAAARVEWLDSQGIDVQNVICLSGMAYRIALEDRDPPLLREAIRACNGWLADNCDAAAGRLLPVTTLDCSDLDWAIEELTRMRARNSRIFLIPGYPVNGIPPCHPQWDRLWSTATDLGMAPMLHVGFERSAFDPGWANLGTDVDQLRQFASSHLHVGAQTLLSAFVFNGVFERHPTLTLLLAELGVGWLPWFHRQIDGRIVPTSELFLGKWKYPLKPSEYLTRNVRGTPLSWATDQPVSRVIEELPDEMIVFSSDFPHFEGYTDPMGYYREALKDLSETRRQRFYGGEMADVFARMGDPIT
ncbi:amidohydrolase [Myxococcota bacterium]|nr:amidohydrolase [Myxococcota bacterium]